MSTWLPQLLAILLSGAVIKLIADAIKALREKHKRTQPQAVERQRVHDAVAAADESIIVVAKARDELAEDNARLREQIVADRQRYDRDRDDWRFQQAAYEAEKKAMRAEVASVETQLRRALGEIEGLKARYGIT